MKIRHGTESLLSRSLPRIEMMPQTVCNTYYSYQNIRNMYTYLSLKQVTKVFALITVAEILEGMAWLLTRIRKNYKIYQETNPILCKQYNWSPQASSRLPFLVKQEHPRVCLPSPRNCHRGWDQTQQNIRRERGDV